MAVIELGFPPGLKEKAHYEDFPSGPSSLPPLFSQFESHGPPIGVGREKNNILLSAMPGNFINIFPPVMEKQQERDY